MSREIIKSEEDLRSTLNGSEILKAVANITMMSQENAKKAVTDHITSIYDIETPKEKIKKRPDGFDYIESTWMDKSFKEWAPLYKYRLLYVNESLGWIDVIISLEDRLTGNTEIGGGSARIQTRRDASEPYVSKDIIDKGNNLKAAITNACKNAESRFGVGADVYGKREATRTEEEKIRFSSMLKEIQQISKTRAQLFETGWNEIGVDFSEYLDKWQIYINRNTKVSTEKSKDSLASDTKVIETKSQIKSNASSTTDNKEIKVII